MSQHTHDPSYGTTPETGSTGTADLGATGLGTTGADTYGTGAMATGTATNGTTTTSTATASPDAYVTDTSGSSTEAAKEATRETAETAMAEVKHLADAAKSEVGNVTSTATDQMRRLMDQSRSELTEQARSQQQRLTGNLRTFTDELDAMVGQSGQQGVAHDVVRQVSHHARTLTDWLELNEPGAVLDEVSRFARRKPGTFLAIAAGVGLLSGRLTRGLAAASSDDNGQPSSATGYTAYGSPTYPAATGMTTTPETMVDGRVTATDWATHTGAVTSDEAAREGWTDRGETR